MKHDVIKDRADQGPLRYEETLAACIAGILVASRVDWPKVAQAMAAGQTDTQANVVLELADECMKQIEDWWPTNNPPPSGGKQIIITGADA